MPRGVSSLRVTLKKGGVTIRAMSKSPRGSSYTVGVGAVVGDVKLDPDFFTELEKQINRLCPAQVRLP